MERCRLLALVSVLALLLLLLLLLLCFAVAAMECARLLVERPPTQPPGWGAPPQPREQVRSPLLLPRLALLLLLLLLAVLVMGVA